MLDRLIQGVSSAQMKTTTSNNMRITYRTRLLVAGLGGMVLVGIAALALSGDRVAAAACATPSTDYGTATYTTLNVPSAGTYEVQARMQASGTDATANSFLLEIDGNTCMTIGDNAAISGSAWTWVDYKDGSTSSKALHTFTAGNHTVKMIGREPGVKLDRLIFTGDVNCVPSGTGDNCANPADTTPPTVSLTAPANSATVSGQVAVSANASDDTSVQKVSFYRGTTLIAEDTSSPYSVNWNTTAVTNGSYALTARAYDQAGNQTTSSTVNVTVTNLSASRAEDINQDGLINLLDFSLLAAKFGQTGSDLGRTDINSDGKVNLQDFSLLASKFGQ